MLFNCVGAGLQVNGLSLNGAFDLIDLQGNKYAARAKVTGYNTVTLTVRNNVTPVTVVYDPNAYATVGFLSNVNGAPVRSFIGHINNAYEFTNIDGVNTLFLSN